MEGLVWGGGCRAMGCGRSQHRSGGGRGWVKNRLSDSPILWGTVWRAIYLFQYCVTSQGQTYWTTTLSWDERVNVVRDNYWRDNYWTADMMAAIWVRCNYNIKWYVITPKVYARRHCYSLQCYVPRWPNMTLKQFIRPIDYSRRNEESSDRKVLSHQVIITTRNVLYKLSKDSVVDTESDTARTGWHINPTWRNQSVLLGHTGWERESNSNKKGSNYKRKLCWSGWG